MRTNGPRDAAGGVGGVEESRRGRPMSRHCDVRRRKDFLGPGADGLQEGRRGADDETTVDCPKERTPLGWRRRASNAAVPGIEGRVRDIWWWLQVPHLYDRRNLPVQGRT